MTDINKAIAEATSHEDISTALDAVREGAVSTVREPRAKATDDVAEPTFTRVENINGRELTFTADSEVELERMIGDAFKIAYAVQQPAPVEEPAPTVDPAKAAVEQAHLEIQFRNGQISAADYLERSNAVADYLEKQGVPVEELKETVEKSRSAKFIQSWSDATQEFLQSPAGYDWRGGQRNLQLIGMKIEQLGLVDAEDKVAALAQAYASMKESGLVFDDAEGSESNRAAQSTQTARESQPVRQATQSGPTATRQEPSQRRTSSGLFGASSGTSANDIQDRSKEPQKVNVPSNASPEEIMTHWKTQILAQGGNVDAAFNEAFSKRK